MQYLIQLLISGLAIGAIYGLIAMGFAVIYKSTGLVNFAQGEMTMITAYIAWTISTTVSGNVFVVAIGAILAAVVLGLVIERLVMRPMLGEPVFATVMVTIGLAVILRSAITDPSNYRATRHLDQWLKARGIIGLSGIDTRALTALIRSRGMPNAVIAHSKTGEFDLHGLKEEAREWPGLEGMDLVPMVTSGQRFTWDETPWAWGKGFGQQTAPEFNVVAIDYGIKRNILRLLAGVGAKVTVVPATTAAEDILAMKPDGVFLSNGPGDPAATGKYAVPVIQKVIASGTPTFGICLGHQMLGLAVGARTMKMHQGHHGANHPVKDETTGKVEITSMNHGFAVDQATLPAGATQTHISLFDGSNCGIALEGKPVFSVQYHPEASPGPRDSHYLFQRFADLMRKKKQAA